MASRSSRAEHEKARLEAAWLEENQAAIQAYNDHVEASGVFSDGLRAF